MSESPELRFDGVKVLLVDDEPNMLRVVRRILHRRGAEVETAANGLDALAALDGFTPDVVLTDLMMPELDGLGLLAALKQRDLDVTVIVFTGHGTMETAIEAMRLGARDYLLKPCDPDEILLVFARELEAARLRRENLRLKTEVSTLSQRLAKYESFGEMVGDSAAMQAVYQQIERLCRFHDLSVLVIGETGTGKELVARALHRGSPRAPHSFVAINCAAIPEDLQESQLFGHRKGSFTGASEDYVGAFEAADKGTLLLDEVGEMRPELQAKLLRALEERAVTPLGRHQPLPVDVRVVAATNRDLQAAVAAGEFRADLYNRLEGAVIALPPLRERPSDLPALAEHFLQKVAADYGVAPKSLSPDALSRLQVYAWPGNVRELFNVLRRAFIFSDTDCIEAAELALHDAPAAAGPAGAAAVPAPPAAAELGRMASQERDLIVAALREARGNKSRAAELLGIDRKRLYRRLRKYGLEE
ncbi:MAG: sigma-54-dependent Fis family transcriptional regulator [Fimbriimonadaceae bacterium]|nr:sigma-54-dependent Fis family transcriptional regulator [Fimbriimonadaceae bacterium]